MVSKEEELLRNRAPYPRVIPLQRLGSFHETLDSFEAATAHHKVSKNKEYTLIVVTTPDGRILLGEKHRGFGKGFYNSFGGKVEPGEKLAASACRELREETNIEVTEERMRKGQVGTLYFTFEDTDMRMTVHLFRIMISPEPSDVNYIDQTTIRGCDEITPRWMEQSQIPFDRMFADDSIWLPNLLAGLNRFDGHFHFQAGGQDTNSIAHWCLQQGTLERRLFHALHRNIHSPSIKEFKEAFGFFRLLRRNYGPVDVVLDVAGGHGALAAVCVLAQLSPRAVVIDPARVGQVREAWGCFGLEGLEFVHECFRTALPRELECCTRQKLEPSRILVVACHACQYLAEEILQISQSYGVQVAVVPCCQRDETQSWKEASKRLQLPIAITMDLLLAGKCQSDSRYDVRLRFLDASVTPQNRVICCRRRQTDAHIQSRVANHEKLQRAYKRAHLLSQREIHERPRRLTMMIGLGLVASVVVGALAMRKRSAY